MKTNVYNEKRYNDFREIVNHSAAKYGKRTAFLLKKEQGGYEKITYGNLHLRFYTLCRFFLAMGLEKRAIAVIGKNSFEWTLSYLCAATVGTVVPIDRELQSEDVKAFTDAAECAAVCAEDSRVEGLKALLPETVQVFSFSEIKEASAAKTAPSAEEYETVNRIEIPRDKMQILIFTSGTTGNAKGVCLSQYNICSDVHSTVSVVKIKKSERTLSVLPLHHTYECSLNCLLLLSRGACITYCESITKLQKNLTEYRPTVLVVVPLLLKSLNKRIEKAILRDCPAKYKPLFEQLSLAQALKKLPAVVRHVISAKVRKSLGGNIRLFIVGAAELDTALIDDFSAFGIRTLQGYGLTECAPLLAGNSDFFMNAASTGVAIPGVTLKIDAPNAEGVGEILAKGDNIMLGYYRDEKATAKVFRDGWFCTGDLGAVGEDGALYIRGRKKNVIVTANGKNIYPEELETRLSQHPAICEAIVLSENESGDVCVKAKVFPNLDYLKEALGHLPTVEEIRTAVQKAIREINSKIPSYKNIKVVEILSAALEKTTTKKIRRCGANMA